MLTVQCLYMFPTVLRFKKMYNKFVKNVSKMLKFVPDHFMCEEAVKMTMYAIIHVPD